MARGKHGAAAAEKRAAAAVGSVEQLRQELAEVKAAAAQRERDLRTELDQLRGRFSSAVREASSEAILAAKESGRQDVAKVNHRRDEQMREAMRFLLARQSTVQLEARDWTRLADLAGIPWGEFLSLGNAATNNKQRRMSTRQARLNAQLKEDHETIGVTAAAGRSVVREDGGAW